VLKFRVPRTIALLGAGLSALLVIVAATLWIAQQAAQNTLDVKTIIDVRIAAVTLRNGAVTAESGQRGFLYTGNEIYLAPFEGAKSEAQRQADRLIELAARVPDLQPLADELATLVEAKIEEMSETTALKRAGRDEAAMVMFLTNRGKALMDQINVFVLGILSRVDERLIAIVSDQEANARLLIAISLAGALVVILVVAATVHAFVRSAREISAARDAVRAVNATLERRVEERTSALKTALERAELL
jgi:CHASE3 domain sensor protein